MEVNFHQHFSSFENLVLAGETLNLPNALFGIRWGNWTGNVWVPQNINDGSILAAQSEANASPNWTAGIGLSSTELIEHGYAGAVSDILDGHFFISFFLCSPSCYNGIGFWYGPVTHSAFEVRLIGAEPTPLPAALPLFATGLGALGLLGWRRKRSNRTLVIEDQSDAVDDRAIGFHS